jgi:hypothetical protein
MLNLLHAFCTVRRRATTIISCNTPKQDLPVDNHPCRCQLPTMWPTYLQPSDPGRANRHVDQQRATHVHHLSEHACKAWSNNRGSCRADVRCAAIREPASNQTIAILMVVEGCRPPLATPTGALLSLPPSEQGPTTTTA